MNLLLPILVLTLPVLAIVLLAVYGGRRLSGSCGASGPDGKCGRCGAPGAEVDRLRAQGGGSSCP